jgi:outer membrane protein OmpA-like peptidoglycan-associated protein
MTRSILVVTAAALALAGCDTTDPNRNRAGEGAAIGAVLGGFYALSRSGDNKLGNAAGGAVAGAIVGGLVGTLLDRQARELERDLDSDVTVVNTGNELIVSMPEGILFAVDSSTVSPGAQDDLAVLAASLVQYPDSVVQVVGHTDNTGSAAYNADLSLRRAATVRSVLVANGVAPGRVRASGRGEDQPVASNLTPEGRALNRRVDVVIRPTGDA